MKGVKDQISSISTKRPSRPGRQPERSIEGQGQILVVKDRGHRQHDAAQHGPSGPHKQAQQNDGFKGDVGGQKVGHLGPHPDAQGQRHQKEGQQGRGLAVAAMLGKEQPLEGAGPGQRAGHGRGHAQLDQQRNQNERIGHPINVSH